MDEGNESTFAMEPGSRRSDPAPIDAWGPFALVARVGAGGFGEVYRAFDSTLQREVALKLLLPRGLDVRAEDQALLQEARALARVRHPNVVPVYGVDRHNGRVGFWSDFVHGKTLAAILADDGPFGPREAALIGIDVGKAVGAVHAAGLLHRDIKAGNVMRESGGRILLMDFGLTHNHHDVAHFGGTPSYMAPELLANSAASVTSDIYALGILLYNMLTGQYPVNASSLQQLVEAHQAGTRKALLDVRPDLPEGLARVVETAAHPDPVRRFQSTGAMIAALSDALGLGPATIVVPAPQGAPPIHSRSKIWIFVAVAVLSLGLPFAWYRVRSSRAQPAVTQSNYTKARDLVDHYYRPRALETAIPLLQQIVRTDPDNALAFSDLARANMQQFIQLRDPKYLEAVREACESALQLKPDLTAAHVTLGTFYMWTGKHDLASQELDRALKLDQFNASAYAALGNLYSRQGRNSEAEAALKRAVDLAPEDWGILGQLASYYDEIGKYSPAIDLYQRAVSLAPDNARAQNNLGLIDRIQNRPRQAEAAYRKSISIEPTAGHYRNLGQALLEEGKYSEARPMLEKSVALKSDDYRSWGFLASLYAATRVAPPTVQATYRKAISLAEALRKHSPENGYLFADLASYYAALGMHRESLQALNQAVAQSPGKPELLYSVARVFESLNQRENALMFAGKAITAGISPGFLAHIPQLTALCADPRFPSLARNTPQTK